MFGPHVRVLASANFIVCQPASGPVSDVYIRVLASHHMSLIRNRLLLFASILIVGLGIVLSEPVAAQDEPRYVPRIWDTEDGLPIQRLLNASLVQTQNGYLWIGTRVGLIRFDGIRFERFSVDNTRVIPDMRITNLFETRMGSFGRHVGWQFDSIPESKSSSHFCQRIRETSNLPTSHLFSKTGTEHFGSQLIAGSCALSMIGSSCCPWKKSHPWWRAFWSMTTVPCGFQRESGVYFGGKMVKPLALARKTVSKRLLAGNLQE